jgi:hypothetical protein
MNDSHPATAPLIILVDDAQQTRTIIFEFRTNPDDPASPRVWMYITASKDSGEITSSLRRHPPV